MITYLTPYYMNGGMLREQLKHLAAMSSVIKKNVQYIVVDDCSPSNKAVDVLTRASVPHWLSNLDFELYRIEVDKPWNHIAARNIAVHNAKHEWLLMTDIDHRPTPRTLENLLHLIEDEKLLKHKVYRFDRVDAPNLTPYKQHPHTWLMNRKVWDKFGGYDERFSGHYGMDFLARERLLQFTEFLDLPDCEVVRYPREIIPDASTTTYKRKTPQDRRAVKEIRARLKAEGTYFNPKTLTFPYNRVYPS